VAAESSDPEPSTRRDLLRKTVFIAPVILTLDAFPAFASAASGRVGGHHSDHSDHHNHHQHGGQHHRRED
jgi:hypothetical protein